MPPQPSFDRKASYYKVKMVIYSYPFLTSASEILKMYFFFFFFSIKSNLSFHWINFNFLVIRRIVRLPRSLLPLGQNKVE